MTRFALLSAAAMALLAGCATTQRLAAAADVHGFLVATRDDDQAAFEAHVDRRALEAEIQSVMIEKSRDPRLGEAGGALGLLLSGPLSPVAGAALLQPEVFRAVAAHYGYRPERPIPGQLSIAAALTSLPDGTVCAKARRAGPCLLPFADEGGTWKLVAFDADTVLRAAGGPRR